MLEIFSNHTDVTHVNSMTTMKLTMRNHDCQFEKPECEETDSKEANLCTLAKLF